MEPQPRLWAWTSRISPRTADILIVLVLAIPGVIAVIVDPLVRGRGESVLTGAAGIGLVLLQSVPLFWRRRWPAAVLAIIAVAFALKPLIGANVGPAGLGLLVATYSLAVYGSGSRRLLPVAVAALAFLAGFVGFILTGNRELAVIAFPSAGFAIAWLIGDYLRTRRAYVAELEGRAARLERERADDRRRAAEEERARIARELHDMVAHDVSLIAVQAGAARTVQDRQPAAASEALALIETTARQTLTELSRLLGVLRRPDASPPTRSPQPGVAQMDALLDQVRSAGIAIRYTVEGEPRPLPPPLDLSVYRIVQEATTNILKHARARHVEVRLRYRAEDLELEVADDGRGPLVRTADPTGGHGLIGMRERVALFGGELLAGPQAGGGFTVTARLPFEPAA
jgi:signal transduction histidine kinase